MPSLSAPLWPAGHLSLKGGDRVSNRLSPTVGGVGCAEALKLPISPLEGEMPSFGKEGRPEGGAS
ncbi:MAG: lytic murein transglycosylase [Mesorhizobium sp.]|nr:MAG: lytic murein transglycosylase [Mesorhizobium sp.]